MKKFLIFILLSFASFSVNAQDVPLDAIIERYDVSFTMNSATSGSYKVNMRVAVLNSNAYDVGLFQVYSDSFRSLSSFTGTLESNGKIIRKFKSGDLKASLIGEGGVTDATVSYLDPVAPAPYVVEYTYEVSYRNGFMSFPTFIPVVDPNVALMSSSYELKVPSGTELAYRSVVEPEKVSGGKSDIYTWRFPTYKGYVYEHMMPSIFEIVPYVYAMPESFTYAKTSGKQTDWNSVGKWLYDLQKESCVISDELRSKVYEMISGIQDDRQKIKVLYDYLRKNTRYVSIQMGVGGLKPFPVDMVMKSGFGDCKALSVYMQALLSAAGIRSEYLILDTDRSNLIDGLYSVGQMNHAMLCVPMQKDTLWIECTNPSLPLGYRHDNIAGHEVVLIGENGGKKVRVKAYPDSLSRSVESVEVLLNTDGSAECRGSRFLTLDSVEPYVGFANLSEKSRFNAIMGSNSLHPTNFKINSVTDNFEEWMTLCDGEEYVPQTTISYEFDAVGYAKVLGDRMFLDINPFAKQIRSDRHARINDYLRTRKLIIEDRIVLKLPQGYIVESIPSTSTVTSQFGSLRTEVCCYDEDGIRRIEVRQTLKMNTGRFGSEEYDSYRNFAKEATRAYSSRIVLRKE